MNNFFKIQHTGIARLVIVLIAAYEAFLLGYILFLSGDPVRVMTEALAMPKVFLALVLIWNIPAAIFYLAACSIQWVYDGFKN